MKFWNMYHTFRNSKGIIKKYCCFEFLFKIRKFICLYIPELNSNDSLHTKQMEHFAHVSWKAIVFTSHDC